MAEKEQKYDFSDFDEGAYDFSDFEETQPTKIVEEMHPDISVVDRAKIKNFGVSPQQSVQFLRQKHPDLDIQIKDGDRIVIRRPDEKEYRVLDPESWSSMANPLEIARDVGDIAWDVGQVGAEGAAALGSGTLGALASGGNPFVALPAAMAGGGAAGAGMEYLRQNIGKALDVATDTDNTDILISGGLGALAPGLFGAGKIGGTALKTGIGQRGAAKALEKAGAGFVKAGQKLSEGQAKVGGEVLQESMRGVVPKTLEAFREMLGGIPNNDLKNALTPVSDKLKAELLEAGLSFDPDKRLSKLDLVDILHKQDEGQFGEAAHSHIYKTLNTARMGKQAEIGNAMLQSNSVFDLNKYAAPIVQVREAIKATQMQGGVVDQAQLDAIEALLKEFDLAEGAQVTAPQLMRIKDRIRTDMNLYGLTEKGKERLGQAGQVVQTAFQSSERLMSADIEKALKQAIGRGELQDGLLKEYKTIKDMDRTMNRYFRTPEIGEKSLRNYSNKAQLPLRRALKDFDKKFNSDLTERAEIGTLYKYFAEPSMGAVGAQGTSPTGNVVKGSLLGTALGSAAGYGIAQVTDPEKSVSRATMGGLAGGTLGSFGSSPFMMKQYLKSVLSAKKVGESTGKTIKMGLDKLPTDKKNVVKKLLETQAGQMSQSTLNYLNQAKPAMSLPAAWELMRTEGGD